MGSLFKYVGTQVREPLGYPGEPSKDILEKCRSLGRELAKKAKTT
jgi:hypothetical protein